MRTTRKAETSIWIIVSEEIKAALSFRKVGILSKIPSRATQWQEILSTSFVLCYAFDCQAIDTFERTLTQRVFSF